MSNRDTTISIRTRTVGASKIKSTEAGLRSVTQLAKEYTRNVRASTPVLRDNRKTIDDWTDSMERAAAIDAQKIGAIHARQGRSFARDQRRFAKDRAANRPHDLGSLLLGRDAKVDSVADLGDTFEELTEGFEQATAVLWPLKLAIGATVGTAVALTGALVTLGVKGVGTYLTKTEDGAKAQGKFTKAMDRSLALVGGSIVGFDESTGVVRLFTEAVKTAGEVYENLFAARVFHSTKKVLGWMSGLGTRWVTFMQGNLKTMIDGLLITERISYEVFSRILTLYRSVSGPISTLAAKVGLGDEVSRGFIAFDMDLQASIQRSAAALAQAEGWKNDIDNLANSLRSGLAEFNKGLETTTMGDSSKMKMKAKEAGKGYKDFHDDVLDKVQEVLDEEEERRKGVFSQFWEGQDVAALEGAGRDKFKAMITGKVKEVKEEELDKDDAFDDRRDRFKKLTDFAMGTGDGLDFTHTNASFDSINDHLNNLADDGLKNAIKGFGNLTKAMIKDPGNALKHFTGYISSMGSMLFDMGLGIELAALGEIALATGNLPAAVAMGAGLMGVGLTMQAVGDHAGGSSRRSGGGGGAGIATAVSDAVAGVADRILANQKRPELATTVNVVLDNAETDAMVRNSLSRQQSQGELALEVIP